MTQALSSNTTARIRLLLVALFIALPLLSVALSLLGWLVHGVDIPYMDDWRPYILNEAGTFAPEILFRPTNDTLFPLGMALDSAALRWLGGNSIAYQAVSMPVVLLSLLGLQWLLLRHVLRDTTLTACAFCLTLLMLQPGSYWGEQNMAFHQAVPLICVLAAIYLVVVSSVSRTWLAALLVTLGLVSGLTYISGAFGYLACGVVLALYSLCRAGIARSRFGFGGLTMALAGLATSIPQAWVIVFYQKGTHRADAPMAMPYEGDFWFYLLGKVGRSLLFPASHPALSLALTLAAISMLVALLLVAFHRGHHRTPDAAEGKAIAYADGFAITLALSAVVAVYLLMVATGRANLRDPSMTAGLQIFSFGYLRFHFFWVTLLWPWVAALALVWWSSRSPGLRRWQPLVAVAACAAYMIWAGALNHMDSFRQLSAARSEGVDCLRRASEAMEPMVCDSIERRDLRPALLIAERANASFTRYLRSSAAGVTPAEGTKTNVLLITPGTFIDGAFVAARSGRISSVAVPIGNFGRTSDGELEISICNALRCATGRANLATSLDNNYVEVHFDSMVPTEEGARVPFRIRTRHAIRPVAVWTAASVEGSAQILRVHDAAGMDKDVPGQTIRIKTWYIR